MMDDWDNDGDDDSMGGDDDDDGVNDYTMIIWRCAIKCCKSSW